MLQDAAGNAVRVVQTRSPGRHPRFDGIDCEGLTARQVDRSLRDHECWCAATKLWVGDDALLARIEDAARIDCMTPFAREEERMKREADMLATIAALTARIAVLEPDVPIVPTVTGASL